MPRASSQFGGGLAEFVQRRIKQLNRLRRVGGDLVTGEAHVDAERHQSLLSTVVQVALDAPPLFVTGLDDAGPRCAQLRDPRPEFRVEAFVPQRELDSRTDGLDEVAVLCHRRVVYHSSKGLTVMADE